MSRYAVATDMDRGLPNGWTNRQGDKRHNDMSIRLPLQKSWSGCNFRTTGLAGFGGNDLFNRPA